MTTFPQIPRRVPEWEPRPGIFHAIEEAHRYDAFSERYWGSEAQFPCEQPDQTPKPGLLEAIEEAHLGPGVDYDRCERCGEGPKTWRALDRAMDEAACGCGWAVWRRELPPDRRQQWATPGGELRPSDPADPFDGPAPPEWLSTPPAVVYLPSRHYWMVPRAILGSLV